MVFPAFGVISPPTEVLENLYNGRVFPNTLGLEQGKKYLVKDCDRYVSLVEEREGDVRILVNNIE